MKHIKLTIHGLSNVLFLIILLVYSSCIMAKNSDYWVDFYKNAHYRGQHFRVAGSAQLNNLLNIKGENWDKTIESIAIGSKAILTVFENKNFRLTLTEMANYPVLIKSLGISKQDILEESEIIFRPNSKVHSFGDYNFYHKIRSLKVKCV